jgi:hypothetical protein
VFDSKMWAVRLSAGNASVAARHVNSAGHSASGLVDMAGDGFDLRSVFSGGLAGSLIARCDCRLLTAWRLNSRTQICRANPQIIAGKIRVEGPSQHPVKRGRLDWAGSGLAVDGLGTSFPRSRPQPGEAEVITGG